MYQFFSVCHILVQIILVYTGDETAAAQFPHGNASNNRNYVRTKPHALHDIRNSGSKSCKNIYQSMITTAVQATVATTVTEALRDLERIRNMKKAIRNNARLYRDSPFLVTCCDYRKRHQPTPHYAWLWTLTQAVNRTSGRSGSASEDDPAERECSRSRTTLGSTPTTPGGSHITASLGGRYDPWPVKRSTD